MAKMDIIYVKRLRFRRMDPSYTNYFTHTDTVSYTSHIRRLIRLSELFVRLPLHDGDESPLLLSDSVLDLAFLQAAEAAWCSQGASVASRCCSRS